MPGGREMLAISSNAWMPRAECVSKFWTRLNLPMMTDGRRDR